MLTRSTESIIRFNRPFRLSQFDASQPAGRYLLITEEERLEGLSFEVFRRVRTLLYLPVNPAPGITREVVDVDPLELAAALIVDALQGFGGQREVST